MPNTIFDVGLDRNAANHQPLTPLGFLERAAAVFPDRTAIVHGALRRNYRDFYARTRRLARIASQKVQHLCWAERAFHSQLQSCRVAQLGQQPHQHSRPL